MVEVLQFKGGQINWFTETMIAVDVTMVCLSERLCRWLRYCSSRGAKFFAVLYGRVSWMKISDAPNGLRKISVEKGQASPPIFIKPTFIYQADK